MDPFRTTASAYTSEASRSSHHHPPHTPPYTPHRPNKSSGSKGKGKRRLERSDSPTSATASPSSVHPAETSSPAKRAAKRAATDNVRVEELAEGDIGYLTDADVDLVYPEETEEAQSNTSSDQDRDGDDELSSSSDSDEEGYEDGSSISRRMSRLRCGDENAEAEFEKGRRLRRMSKRMGSRVFKRSHSQSVKHSDAEEGVVSSPPDADAMDDQDVPASQRRLRRRVQGPALGPREAEVVYEDTLKSSSEAGSARKGTGRAPYASQVLVTPERDVRGGREVGTRVQRGSDAMDVDDEEEEEEQEEEEESD